MTFGKATSVLGTLLLVTTPTWASTIFGGFEDTVSTTTGSTSDYDYNDLVFKITGVTFDLTSGSGTLFPYSPAILNNSGSPFWNHYSSDSPSATDNIGYCIYGGPAGSCGGLAPQSPGAQYLAASNGSSAVSDVAFFATSGTTGSVAISITADKDSLYWATAGTSPNDPNASTDFHLIYLAGTATPSVPVTINPGMNPFELIGCTGALGAAGTNCFSSNSPTSMSHMAAGDPASQFAFFQATPEPASMALLGTGLLGLGFFTRKKKRA